MNRSLEVIHRQLQSAVERLVDSDEWRAMLEVAASFHNYSVNNQLLIYLQCPQATRVCGYRAWQRFGHQVRKGERGIQILAPCRRVKAIQSEVSDEPERVQVRTGFRVVQSSTSRRPTATSCPRSQRGGSSEMPRSICSTRSRSGSPPRDSCSGARRSRRRRATATPTSPHVRWCSKRVSPVSRAPRP